MEDELTLTLRMAPSRRVVSAGLAHHSDRGSQYAGNDYTDPPKAHGIAISISRKANPWANAGCESFMNLEVRGGSIATNIGTCPRLTSPSPEFPEKIDNQKRLHSALGCLPPAELEAQHRKDAFAAASPMSFMRHRKTFPSDGGSLAANAPAHR